MRCPDKQCHGRLYLRVLYRQKHTRVRSRAKMCNVCGRVWLTRERIDRRLRHLEGPRIPKRRNQVPKLVSG